MLSMLDSSTFVLNVFKKTKKMHSLLFYLYLLGCNTMIVICCNRILLANNMLSSKSQLLDQKHFPHVMPLSTPAVCF